MMIFKKKQAQCQDAAQKQPEEKNPLLQTYFSSLLCMALCVAMFLGTSYAWFTSEVNNTGNEIYIGMLDVGLYKQDGSESKDLSDGVTKLFDSDIRWEPGYTTLETLQIVNEGDLAFKYALNFTDGIIGDGTDPTEDPNVVASVFDVWVYDHQANEGAPQTATYADMLAANSGWVKVGTLAEVLAGKPVLSGVKTALDKTQEAESQEADESQEAAENQEIVKPLAADTYTIALHMHENAGVTAVMGKKLGLNVKLVAYQLSEEADAFGNQYDRLVTGLEELKDALKTSGTVALAADIDLSQEQLTVPAGVAAILDLNGHKITATVDQSVSLITNQGNLTINGDGEIAVIFTGAVADNKAINAISNRGVLTVNGGKITNTGVGNQIGYAIDNYNGAVLTVNGGEITASGSSYYDGIRLFCGSTETVVTVNGGEISSIWAQNPSDNKATEVKGTVIVNGGEIGMLYYENYTTVKVLADVVVTVTPYGAGSENTASTTEDGYTVYRFVRN